MKPMRAALRPRERVGYFLSQDTTTYLAASSPRLFTASCLVIALAELVVTVTFWVPGLSPAAISTLETPSSLLNASRTCTLQPPQVTPVMPAT
jgi:hypothetical protein